VREQLHSDALDADAIRNVARFQTAPARAEVAVEVQAARANGPYPSGAKLASCLQIADFAGCAPSFDTHTSVQATSIEGRWMCSF